MSLKAISVLKVLLITYALTGVMLVIFAYCLYKLRFTNTQVDIGIMIIYAVSTVLGGYMTGKKQRNQRLIWGLAFGVLYFVVLSIVSLIISRGSIDSAAVIKALVICVLGGICGGILSPTQG